MVLKAICDNCLNDNVLITKEKYDCKYDTHIDYATLDYYVTELVSYKERLICKCNDCGHISYVEEVRTNG